MLKRLVMLMMLLGAFAMLGIGQVGATIGDSDEAAEKGVARGHPRLASLSEPWWKSREVAEGESYWAMQMLRDGALAPEWLGTEVFGFIDAGLDAMAMSRTDLDFSKRVAGPQEHLLEPVRRTLDESLSVPLVADGLVEASSPWVTLEMIPEERLEKIVIWSSKLDFLGLVNAVVGDDGLATADNARSKLEVALEQRGWKLPCYSYLVDFVNRGEHGADLDVTSFTGASARLLDLVLLAACVSHDLRQRPVSTIPMESAFGLTTLFGDTLNGAALPKVEGETATVSGTAATLKSAMVARSSDAQSSMVRLDSLTMAEACVVWPYISTLIACEMLEVFEGIRTAYQSRRVDAPKIAGELIMSGLDAVVMPDHGGNVDKGEPSSRNVPPRPMRFVIGGFGRDRHAPQAVEGGDAFGQPLLLVDVGGRDEYPLCCAVAGPGEFVAVYDFGDEPDVYGGGELAVRREAFVEDSWLFRLGPCAAVMGCAVLEDFGGDDVYSGGDLSLGAAWGGAAYLTDYAGSDVYRGRQFTQGAAAFGVAELTDFGETPELGENSPQGKRSEGIESAGLDSNDDYRCARYGQGFGFVLGIARLEDGGGNDRYYAGGVYRHMPLWDDRYQTLSQGMGFGWRSENVAGGIGLLIDRGEGNDSYEADIYGQGSSYWYSFGVCWDEGGNDHYRLGQYGQGAGIHLSTGILVDKGGNDSYTNINGVGCGGAHDYAVGWLIDLSGDDVYYANGLAQALNNSTSFFYDGAGNDCYTSRVDSAIGYGVNNSVAFLIDGGGRDGYTIPVTNGLWHVRGEYGIVMDLREELDSPSRTAVILERRVDGGYAASRKALLEAISRAEDGAVPSSGDAKAAEAAPIPGAAGRASTSEEVEALWNKACEWEVGSPENIKAIRDARRTLVELGALDFLMGQLYHTYPLQLRALWGTIPYFGEAAVNKLASVSEQSHSRLTSSGEERSAKDVGDDVGRRRNAIDLLTRLQSHLVAGELRVECLETALQVEDERERIRLLTSLCRWKDLHPKLVPAFVELLLSGQDLVRKLAVEALPPIMNLEAAFEPRVEEILKRTIATDPYFAVRWGCLKLLITGSRPTNAAFDVEGLSPEWEIVQLMDIVRERRDPEHKASMADAPKSVVESVLMIMNSGSLGLGATVQSQSPARMTLHARLALDAIAKCDEYEYDWLLSGEYSASIDALLRKSMHPAVVGAALSFRSELLWLADEVHDAEYGSPRD